MHPCHPMLSNEIFQYSKSWYHKQSWVSGGFRLSRYMQPSVTMSCRAYNISHRKAWVGRLLFGVYIVAVGVRCFHHLSDDSSLMRKQFEWFADFYRRFSKFNSPCHKPIA